MNVSSSIIIKLKRWLKENHQNKFTGKEILNELNNIERQECSDSINTTNNIFQIGDYVKIHSKNDLNDIYGTIIFVKGNEDYMQKPYEIEGEFYNADELKLVKEVKFTAQQQGEYLKNKARDMRDYEYDVLYLMGNDTGKISYAEPGSDYADMRDNGWKELEEIFDVKDRVYFMQECSVDEFIKEHGLRDQILQFE